MATMSFRWCMQSHQRFSNFLLVTINYGDKYRGPVCSLLGYETWCWNFSKCEFMIDHSNNKITWYLITSFFLYRSLNVEKENKENKEKEKEKLSNSSSFALSSGTASTNGTPTSTDNENGILWLSLFSNFIACVMFISMMYNMHIRCHYHQYRV